MRGGVSRKAGTVGDPTQAPQHNVKVDIGGEMEAGVEKPLGAQEETQGQVTAIIGELEGDRSAERKAARHNQAVELEERLNTTSALIPEGKPQPPPLSSSRGDLFILRSARGLSPLLSRIQKLKEEENNGKGKSQLGKQKEREDSQLPSTLHSDLPLSAESPPAAVPQETQVIFEEQSLKTQIAKKATKATITTTPSAHSPTTSNNSPILPTNQVLTTDKSTTKQVRPLHK